jgi:hypothetical protein
MISSQYQEENGLDPRFLADGLSVGVSRNAHVHACPLPREGDGGRERSFPPGEGVPHASGLQPPAPSLSFRVRKRTRALCCTAGVPPAVARASRLRRSLPSPCPETHIVRQSVSVLHPSSLRDNTLPSASCRFKSVARLPELVSHPQAPPWSGSPCYVYRRHVPFSPP